MWVAFANLPEQKNILRQKKFAEPNPFYREPSPRNVFFINLHPKHAVQCAGGSDALTYSSINVLYQLC
jgi:hypothetical protein